MYKATLTSNRDTHQHKIYYGITKTKFKQIRKPHKILQALKHRSELLNELWSIKSSNYTPNIAWEILQKHQTYDSNAKKVILEFKRKTSNKN